MAAADADTERTVVKTYLPRYQKEAWKGHADDLEMSQSEFVRTMVQAGRRGFDPGGEGDDSGSAGDGDGGGSGGDPSGAALDDRVLAALEREGPLSWDDLVDAVTDDIEGRLERALDDLQARNRIKYSGREGGYVRVDR